MDIQEAVAKAQDAITVNRVYGEPYERDGAVFIPAARSTPPESPCALWLPPSGSHSFCAGCSPFRERIPPRRWCVVTRHRRHGPG